MAWCLVPRPSHSSVIPAPSPPLAPRPLPLQVGKLTPYEEDVRVPLYVRGPGVPQGLVLPHLVTNTDLTPTWLELAGA